MLENCIKLNEKEIEKSRKGRGHYNETFVKYYILGYTRGEENKKNQGV